VLVAEESAAPSNGNGALTVDQVREALRVVLDPEIGLPIVDLGLVYDIAVEDSTVKVVYTLTTMGCPVGPLIEHQARAILEELPGVTAVDMQLIFDPPWSPDLMTEEARAALGMF
jgi:metal-sulfur cluster biosynthetic enzyme